LFIKIHVVGVRTIGVNERDLLHNPRVVSGRSDQHVEAAAVLLIPENVPVRIASPGCAVEGTLSVTDAFSFAALEDTLEVGVGAICTWNVVVACDGV